MISGQDRVGLLERIERGEANVIKPKKVFPYFQFADLRLALRIPYLVQIYCPAKGMFIYNRYPILVDRPIDEYFGWRRHS